jgi:endonuclease VIII
MPEGDTIFRTAVTLRRVLQGHAITRFEAPGLTGQNPGPVVGTVVRDVESRGKHLLMHLADGLTLHTHMQMEGSWHLYRHGERWWKGTSHARAIVETSEFVTVCFDAPVVELLDHGALERHPQLSSLGPDLCSPAPDIEEALRRMDRVDPSTPVGVVLLDQRVAAGVGNVYKSEVLHACRVDPFAPVGAVRPDTRRLILETASTLLRRNLSGGRRRTVPEGLAVYDRAGRPCRACGARIRHSRQGEQGRSTWWCPACQRPARGASGAHRLPAVDAG